MRQCDQIRNWGFDFNKFPFYESFHCIYRTKAYLCAIFVVSSLWAAIRLYICALCRCRCLFGFFSLLSCVVIEGIPISMLFTLNGCKSSDLLKFRTAKAKPKTTLNKHNLNSNFRILCDSHEQEITISECVVAQCFFFGVQHNKRCNAATRNKSKEKERDKKHTKAIKQNNKQRPIGIAWKTKRPKLKL